MSEKMLTETQIRILDNLMDSDENVKQLKVMLKNIDNYIVDDESIIEALLFLLKNKYIACIEPEYDTKQKAYYPREILSPELSRIDQYWFKISEKGRSEVDKKCYHKYWKP